MGGAIFLDTRALTTTTSEDSQAEAEQKTEGSLFTFKEDFAFFLILFIHVQKCYFSTEGIVSHFQCFILLFFLLYSSRSYYFVGLLLRIPFFFFFF